ncbi:MAG: glycosyltransferase [Phocaeicola sp.]
MIELLDTLLFGLTLFTVIYLFIFALTGSFKRKEHSTQTAIKHRFAIIVPTYKDDKYVVQTVESLLQQEYPLDCYEIVVVADTLKAETLERLTHYSITLFKAHFKQHSKTRAIQAAVKALPEKMYDIALILNADNTVAPDFLEKINCSFAQGANAIQCHRLKKEATENLSILEALSDEIENTIFRAGQTKLNLSSSLNGSGMAFDYQWFKKNMEKLAVYEDEKQLQSLLLRDRIYIEYLDHALVYTVKKGGEKRYFQQRNSWVKMHYQSLLRNIRSLFPSLLDGNIDYSNLILQWVMIPRYILFGVIIAAGITCCLVDWTLSIKWWSTLLFYLFTMAIATPNYLVDSQFNKAVKRYPFLFVKMIFYSLFFPQNRDA